MKKIICLGLALIMSLSMTAFASEIKGFSDVAETDWSYSYIMLCVEHGAIDGTTPPDENGIGQIVKSSATLFRQEIERR